ncbi:energy transducer TonB [Sphingomonas sp. Tas61C01]|uniref:energy transducer TonB n=1 Tax=Sphingomonas sp. Tas61C01 TaxID=3458297 RepID=UPI00403E415B
MIDFVMLLALLPATAAPAQEAVRKPAMVPAPRPIPAPPIVADQRQMLTWQPTILRCEGRPITATPMRRPLNALVWSGFQTKPVSFAFSIDASGRTLGIRRQRDNGAGLAEDLGPALAATRFPAKAPRGDCTIVYAPQMTSMAETPIAELISYSLAPEMGALPWAGWERIAGTGDCRDEPRPQALLQAYPDFRTLPGTPGARDWSMVRYDLDAKGRPTAVGTLTGTGNAALDAAAVTAIRASRYTSGARTGCQYPYWRAPLVLAPPPMPPEAAFRPTSATCPAGRDWTTPPVLTFPEAYRRRSIEGWAIVTYDLAPWGEPGNIHAVAAEPSADFGTQAEAVVRGARLPASDRGATGCVDRVIFKIGPRPGPPPPPPF